MRALFALFIRSLREDTRARLPVILRATLVLVILLVLWGNERRFTQRTAPGLEFLGMVMFINLGLVAIATLGIFSTAISEEKEDQTLTLLRMTRLSPLAILFGKGVTRLIGALLLLAAQIPFTLLAVTLGGVSMEQVLKAYAVLGAKTFAVCNIALLFSVLCRTGLRAGIWTGVACAVTFVVLPYVCITTALQRLNFGALAPTTAWERFGTWLVEANPAYTMAVLLFNRGGTAPLEWHITANLTAGVLCFAASWLLFDRFCINTAETAAGRRKKRANMWMRHRRARPSARLPLAWKDFHFTTGGWRGMIIRTGVCALILFAAVMFEALDVGRSFYERDYCRALGGRMMFLAACFLALDLALTASRVFGDERRHLTLGGLTGLPRTIGWILWQKLLGCLPSLLTAAVFFAAGLVCRFVLSPFGYHRMRNITEADAAQIFLTVAHLVFLPALAAWLSLRMRRGAMPAAIAIVVALNVLIAILADLGGERLFQEFVNWIEGVCLLLSTVCLIVGIRRRLPAVAAAE